VYAFDVILNNLKFCFKNWSRNTPKSGPNDTRVVHRVEINKLEVHVHESV